MTQDIFAAIAKAKGRDAAAPTGALDLPFSQAVQREEQARRDAEIRANARTGEVMPDGSVYLGTFRRFSRVFNAYAAPEDLPGVRTYRDTNAYLARLKDWHGHDGAAYRTDDDLFIALDRGAYRGEWIVPPVTLLHGFSNDKRAKASQTLHGARNIGALKGSFKTPSALPGALSDLSEYYWSSTVPDDDGEERFIERMDVTTLRGRSAEGTDAFCSCRPVRLEPAP